MQIKYQDEFITVIGKMCRQLIRLLARVVINVRR